VIDVNEKSFGQRINSLIWIELKKKRKEDNREFLDHGKGMVAIDDGGRLLVEEEARKSPGVLSKFAFVPNFRFSSGLSLRF